MWTIECPLYMLLEVREMNLEYYSCKHISLYRKFVHSQERNCYLLWEDNQFHSIVFLLPGTNITRQILPKGAQATSIVQIRENDFQLRIDHFSWHIVAFIRSLFTRHIEICCFSLLPTCMPKGRKLSAHVQIYKAKKGMREVITQTVTTFKNF